MVCVLDRRVGNDQCTNHAGDFICGWVSCGCWLSMVTVLCCSDLHCHQPVLLSHLPEWYCYRLSTLNVTQTWPLQCTTCSIDLYFYSVPVDLMTAINLNIIFKTTSAVRWLRKGGQAEHPCSREERSGRNLSADTPRDVVRRGQGSNTPVGQESGC